ncbi:response regulator transcription factor [Streptomyces sp. NPDC005728]|uniref:response regulator transcription factor n=1 Tax=Streptomyces sp. NPDC005728 TaxID=3157054 RepID=UPI0033E6B6A8
MIRLLIAEDVHMVRGALVALLKLEPDFAVVAEVGHGDEILPAARRTRPEVAVVDVGLPGTDGLTAAIELRKVLPDCRTVILTSNGRPAIVRRALDNGLEGLLLKDSPPERLAAAIRDVMSGQRVFDPHMTLDALDLSAQILTLRETEVLQRAADGLDASHIAEQLHLSIGTVRNYLTRIVSKLNARNRVDAIRMAREAGII